MASGKTGRLAAYAIFLGAGVSSASVAVAQTPELPIPPVRSPVDSNGVNLATGAFQIPTVTDLSIGAPGEAGLAHTQSLGGPGWLHGFVLCISTTANGVSVIIGGKNYTFTLSNGVYTNDQGDGATLTATTSTYVYTMADGTVVTFDRTIANAGATVNSYATVAAMIDAVATKIELPSAEIITLTYKTGVYTVAAFNITVNAIRLQSVTNNLGYQLKYTYPQGGAPTETNADLWFYLSKVTGINNTVDYCDPAADSCTGLTQTWPSVTYARTIDNTLGLRHETRSDALNRVTRFTFDRDNGHFYALKRPSSSVDNVTIAPSGGYDANGRVTQITKDGATWTYGWSLSGTTLTATITDPLSHQRVTTANTALSVILTDKDALNRTTSYTYDTKGRLTRVTAPEGNYVDYTYDARGNVTQTTSVAKSGSGLSNIVTSASYDTTCSNLKTCNQPNSTTDARSNVTNYTYDATHGGVLTVTAPAVGGVSPQTRYSYTAKQAWYKDSSGSLAGAPSSVYKLTGVSACQTTSSCTGAADEVKTTITYGGAAGTANNLLPTAITTGSGNGTLAATTTTTYDSVGNASSVDGPLSGTADTTSYFYDAARQRTMTVSPDPDGSGGGNPLLNRATKVTYNADGQPTVVEQGTANANGTGFSTLIQQNATYDAAGRKTLDTVTSGGTTYSAVQYSYDSANRPECTAQRMNPAIFGSLPSSACTLGAAGSYGADRINKNVYDNADQLVKIQSGYGTSLQQDTVATTYSNNGKVASVKDANGNLTSYDYDGFDRLKKTRYPNTAIAAGTSSSTDYEELVYDANSNVTVRRVRGYASDSTKHIDYTYDALNRVTNKDLPSSEPDVTYGYDLFGRMTSATDTTSHSIGYSYDALGRMITQTSPLGTTGMAYDLAGRRTRLTWPDTYYVDYDYLLTGEVSKVRENGATSGAGVLASYGYNNLGLRTSSAYGNSTSVSYGYDAIGRTTTQSVDLASTANDTTTTLSYSPASQIVTRTRSNTAYAFTSAVAANRPYVTNGLNQYSTSGSVALSYDARGNLAGSGSDTYSYSSENLMTGATVGGTASTFAYDPMLRLYTPAGGNRVLYDGTDWIADYNSSNALLRHYVFGPGTDEPIAITGPVGSGSRTWLNADERGSVMAKTDATGAASILGTYDEYGIPGPTNVARFQYTGQAFLSGIGLSYYKARMYSPTLGRFMQSDPIGYDDGMNIYAYVGNDPINRNDPTGTDGITVTAPRCPGCNDFLRAAANAEVASMLSLATVSVADLFGPAGPMLAVTPEPGAEEEGGLLVTGRLKKRQTSLSGVLSVNFAPADPQSGKEGTELACGQFESGNWGCGQMSHRYLCKSSQDRQKFIRDNVILALTMVKGAADLKGVGSSAQIKPLIRFGLLAGALYALEGVAQRAHC